MRSRRPDLGHPRAQSVDRDGEPRRHDEAALGRAVHRVIARLLADGPSEPRPEEILAYAAGDPLLTDTRAYRLAARARLISLVAIYLRFLRPGMPWGFLEGGVGISPGDLDLSFDHGITREVRIDELKTGMPAWTERPELDEQVERELRAAQQRYGRRFVGVRVLFLAAPARSFIVDPNGDRRSIAPEERGA